jgi:hypothetical protein
MSAARAADVYTSQCAIHVPFIKATDNMVSRERETESYLAIHNSFRETALYSS